MNAQLFLAVGSLTCIVAAIMFAWNGSGPWGWFLVVALMLASAALG